MNSENAIRDSIKRTFMVLLAACIGAPALAQSPGKPSYAPFYAQCHAAHRAPSADVRVQRDKTYECTIAAAIQAGVLSVESVRECGQEFAAVDTGHQYKILRCAYLQAEGPKLDERQWRQVAEEVCLARSELLSHRYQGANRQQCLIDTLLAQRSAPSPARRAECAKDRQMEFQCLLTAPR